MEKVSDRCAMSTLYSTVHTLYLVLAPFHFSIWVKMSVSVCDTYMFDCLILNFMDI